jgi:beta-N-acetylhexosaminidase
VFFSKKVMLKRFFFLTVSISVLISAASNAAFSQVSLRQRIGQMVMVTVTGESLEESSPSMDTLRSDLSRGLVGGLLMFTWSNNLKNPAQITHFTTELQHQSTIPLLLAIDEEGGKVARLGPSNGFSGTPSAHQMGTVVNSETNTRNVARTMAGWFVQTGLNVNLAPVVDINVNPASPAIGALGRSFSAKADSVVLHAGWFIDEFRKRNICTTLKHFPGHGSASSDSHLGFTDVTSTWTPGELIPYARLLEQNAVDAVMTAHVFNAHLDSVYPATLSVATITGILRNQLGYRGVVFSDEMSMKAISGMYGLDEAMELAVNAGVDMLLYSTNLDSAGHSLAARVVDVLERSVRSGRISEDRINASYERITALKSRLVTGVAARMSPEQNGKAFLVNYPNPFNPTTTIGFGVAGSEWTKVTLIVYDLLGRVVAVLVNTPMLPGKYTIGFDASGMASGMYLCRLSVGKASVVHRIMLVR